MPTKQHSERTVMAARLKEAREYLGLSQEEVAAILKIPRSAVSLIESGERKVDALELKSFSALYKCDVDFLAGAQQTPASTKVQHLARAASKLRPEDVEELVRFAQFLEAKSRSEKPR